ncbi:MAG: hypothetical protein J6S67_07140 [Methanobrevibacter sp.]|nr:hypothetical protein [Methanobrevibacter sp.]
MLITNFASGELSASLNGRVDIQQYYQGANRIENFEIIPTGGIKRRVGIQRVAELGGENRIIPFIVDKDHVYVFELGENPAYDPGVETSKPGLINVWKKNIYGQYAIFQTLYTNYASIAEMKEIHFAQNYDTMVLVHKNYKPTEIVRVLNPSEGFTQSDMTFDFYPDVQLDDDFDYVMICVTSLPTKQTTTDGHGKFTYYKPVGTSSELTVKDYPKGMTNFYCILDGKLYEWNNTSAQWDVYGNDPGIDTELFTNPGKYPSCVAFFNNRLYFASTINEPQKVWASAAPDSTGVRYRDFATYKKYVTVNRTTKESDLHVFTCDIHPEDVSGGHTTLRNVSQDFTQGLEKSITEYYITGNGIPIGTKVISATASTLVIDTTNITFPTHVEESEGEEPVVVTDPLLNDVCTIQLWRSSEVISSDDYDVVIVANNITTADCSLFFELASDENDAIKFLSSNRFLAVGTESSIWSIDPGITALNVNAIMQGRYGSDELQGQAVETATVYFAQGKKGIREFYYDGESNAFRTNNIALLADHILRESAAIDFDYMTNPYSRLIIVRQDGTVAEMLYDKTNGIMAWSHIIHGNGSITNCAVTRGEDENDLIFFVVYDGVKYYLELLDFGADFVYLDSWQRWKPTYSTLIAQYDTGAIIWNKTTGAIVEYADFSNIPQDFFHAGDECFIGYPFLSYIKSMPIIGKDPSRPVRISNLIVRFLESYKPVVRVTGLPDEKFTTIQTVPYSGIGKVNYPGATDHDVCFELEADGLEPVNILSVDAQTA